MYKRRVQYPIRIFSRAGASLGWKNIISDGTFRVVAPEKVTFVGRISINPDCYINGMGGVTFGRNVVLSVGAKIISTGLAMDEGNRISSPHISAPVCIEDNVWICADAIVLKGVTVGKNSVVGAGAVVTESVPPGVLVCGAPAKVVRALSVD